MELSLEDRGWRNPETIRRLLRTDGGGPGPIQGRGFGHARHVPGHVLHELQHTQEGRAPEKQRDRSSKMEVMNLCKRIRLITWVGMTYSGSSGMGPKPGSNCTRLPYGTETVTL